MDSVGEGVSGAVGLANALGVSLPRTHRLLDALGVPPSAGRGRARPVTLRDARRAVDLAGATPVRAAGVTREQLLVLKALITAPTGIEAARAVARSAGVSPSTATAALAELGKRELVWRQTRVVARNGRVRPGAVWLPRQPATWPENLLRAVKAVTLPRTPAATRPGAVPTRLHHWFWNADPRALSLPEDGAYVAARLIDSGDYEATTWALRNLDKADVVAATSRRGTAPRQRALARLTT